MQLNADELKIWKQKFFDLSIESIFPQLDRPYFTLPDEEKEITIYRKFVGVPTEPSSIKNTLERHGWRKGAAGDGGYIDSFVHHDPAGKIQAVLEVEGVFVGGYGSDYEPKLGRLYFINITKVKERWFNSPKDDKDERLIPLGELPDVLYSEVMASIKAIRLKQ